MWLISDQKLRILLWWPSCAHDWCWSFGDSRYLATLPVDVFMPPRNTTERHLWHVEASTLLAHSWIRSLGFIMFDLDSQQSRPIWITCALSIHYHWSVSSYATINHVLFRNGICVDDDCMAKVLSALSQRPSLESGRLGLREILHGISHVLLAAHGFHWIPMDSWLMDVLKWIEMTWNDHFLAIFQREPSLPRNGWVMVG